MIRGRRLTGLPRDRRGAAAILVALAFMVLAGATALATDAGLLQWQRRRLQAAVDAAALSAVRAPAESQAQRATEAVTGNGFPSATVNTQAGTYTPDPSLAFPGRFVAGGSSPSAASAVQVRAETNAPVTLMRLLGSDATIRVAARATAAHQPQGAFTIGSGLLAVDTANSPLLNSLLGGLLGTNLSLNAADYNGLLGARAGALSFLDALAIAANVTAGSYNALLESTVGVGMVLNAAANALSPNAANLPVRDTLLRLAGQVGDNRTLRLGDLLTLGGSGSRPVGSLGDDVSYATLGINVYELLSAAAAVGGRDQVVQLGTILDISPIARVDASLTLIEPTASSNDNTSEGHIALGPVGVRARTSQLRLTLGIKLLDVDVLGLVSMEVNLPVMVEAAWATGTLTSVSCGAEPANDVAMTIAVQTGAVAVGLGSGSATAPQRVRIAELTTLFGLLPVLTVDAVAGVTVGQGQGTANFSAAQIAAGTPQTVSAPRGGGQLLGNLLSTLDLHAEVVGLLPIGLTKAGVLEALQTLLNTMAGTLDPLLMGLLNALGVTVGYAEVRPSAARCGVVALVQ